MCAVFKARDLRFGDVVALKTLHQMDPNSLYRLKQEFRALSAIDHPNLVSFYELVGSKEGWFVTMELVEGQDFLRFSRRTDTGALHRFDEIRLRSTLRQLAEGVATLHESGHIHRDLKAENVLVTASGRVVVLDFGLVLEHDVEFTEGTLQQNLAGSAAYMSPEQSLGETVGPASDWYSVGVMLYESLTGRWPFEGNIYEILMAKHEQDPPPPSSLVPDVPADLNRLCMALLARRPADRPGVRQILAQLASRRPMLDVDRAADFHTRLPLFADLKDCFDRSVEGSAVVCRVSGEQGVGKTGIIREFIRRLKREGKAHALKGRCYEWERVPYKALDGVLDNLTRVFRRQSGLDTNAIPDDQLACLAMLFPVVLRVDSLAREPSESCLRWDRARREAEALSGFCGLLKLLATHAPVLLFLDDVQWADVQSAAFLSQAIVALRDSRVLALLCDDGVVGGYLQATQRSLRQHDMELVSITVKPLPLDEAAAVAGSLLRMPTHRDVVQQIARDSEGAPARILELSRLELVRGSASNGRNNPSGLDSVMTATLQELSGEAQRLLHLIAIAGPSVLTDVVIGAAALGEASFDALSTLRAHQLVDVTTWISEDRVEIASSELRDFLVARLPSRELERLYYDLAIALELSDEYNPRSLVRFYVGSGHYAKASMVATRAAREASRQGDYQEVSWLLERGLDLGNWSELEQRELYVRLARARARVGVGGQVARVYESALQHQRSDELLAASVEQWLASGQVERGRVGLLQLLKQAAWPWSGTPTWRWITSRWWDRDYEWPVASQKRMTESTVLETLLESALALAWTDRSLGYWTHMQSRSLLTAEVGQEVLTKAYLNEALYHCLGGEDPSEGMAVSLQLAESIGSRRLLAHYRFIAGHLALVQSKWVEALLQAGEASRILAQHCPERLWQRRLCDFIVLRSQLSRGEWGDVAERLRGLRSGFDDEDNPLWATLITTGIGAWIRMAEDEAEVGIRESVERLRTWPTTTFWTPHAYAICALGNLYVYLDELDEAWALLRSSWRMIQTNAQKLDPSLRADLYLLRAKVALQMARRVDHQSHWLAIARASMQEAAEVDVPWVEATLLTLQAFCEVVEGRGDGRDLYLAAYSRFQDCDMRMHTAILAIILDGAVEDPLAARNWLSEQGIRDLRRFATVLVPTLDDR